MDGDSLGYSINKSSFLEDITNPCDINTKELVPIEGETLISTTTMDLPATSLISSIDLPSLNASLDLHSITSIPSCIQSVESSSTFSNVNSGLLLETVMGSDIEMSDSYFMPQLAPKVDCSGTLF